MSIFSVLKLVAVTADAAVVANNNESHHIICINKEDVQDTTKWQLLR